MGRLRRIIQIIIDALFDRVETSIPLERRLASDRQQRAAKVKDMLNKATDIGQAAEMMVQALAGARIQAASIREEIEGDVQAAKAAKSRGDTVSEQQNMAQAAALADDLAEAEADIAGLEQTVNDSLRDKEDAKRMVLEQATELERLARHDTRIIARVRITEMRQQTLDLREALLGIVPGDQDDIRGRVLQKTQEQEARVTARSELVDALWKQKSRGQVNRLTQVSKRGAQILQELQDQAGYVPTQAMPASLEEQQAATKTASS